MWKYLLEKEFKQFFRDPGLPRMALMFPVLMMLVFPFAVSMDIRNINLAVVDNCGCDTSCYQCLRNYYNQKIHDQLNRHAASVFLRPWVGQMTAMAQDD